jgi:hypothetical protein
MEWSRRQFKRQVAMEAAVTCRIEREFRSTCVYTGKTSSWSMVRFDAGTDAMGFFSLTTGAVSCLSRGCRITSSGCMNSPPGIPFLTPHGDAKGRILANLLREAWLKDIQVSYGF